MYYSNKYNSLRELTGDLNEKKVKENNIITIFQDQDNQYVVIYKI